MKAIEIARAPTPAPGLYKVNITTSFITVPKYDNGKIGTLRIPNEAVLTVQRRLKDESVLGLYGTTQVILYNYRFTNGTLVPAGPQETNDPRPLEVSLDPTPRRRSRRHLQRKSRRMRKPYIHEPMTRKNRAIGA